MLLALKAEAEKAAAPPAPEEERVIRDAPQRVSDFGPLALAPGRLKVRNHHFKTKDSEGGGSLQRLRGRCLYIYTRAHTHTHALSHSGGGYIGGQA